MKKKYSDSIGAIRIKRSASHEQQIIIHISQP